jgi:twitching motility protein PilU
MDKDSAVSYVHSLLNGLLKKEGSDLFITAEAPPSIKVSGQVRPLSGQPLNDEQSRFLVRSIMNDRQVREFEASMECNFSINLPGKARFRVN